MSHKGVQASLKHGARSTLTAHIAPEHRVTYSPELDEGDLLETLKEVITFAASIQQILSETENPENAEIVGELSALVAGYGDTLGRLRAGTLTAGQYRGLKQADINALKKLYADTLSANMSKLHHVRDVVIAEQGLVDNFGVVEPFITRGVMDLFRGAHNCVKMWARVIMFERAANGKKDSPVDFYNRVIDGKAKKTSQH